MLQHFRWVAVLIIFLSACSTTKQTIQLSNNAHQAFAKGDYQTALTLYEQFIAQHSQPPGLIPDTLYRNAGLSAFELGKTDKTLEYLNMIRYSEIANAPTQYALAVANREINNLSRELTALESYVYDLGQVEHLQPMQQRLFETYVESQNYEKALELWPLIEEQGSLDENLLNGYFTTLAALEKNDGLFDTAQKLLSLNPDNTDALHHLALHYFDKAENRYQTEMQNYENNRTHKQYALLLKGFEILNADFKTSLKYFLKLYELDPKPRYARYIGNIYLRFDDKNKARFYHDKAND